MAGTPEGSKKTAETRGQESLSKAGQKGGEHSHGGKGEGGRSGEERGTSGSQSSLGSKNK